MADIQSPTAEIRRGEKKEEDRRNHRAKILWSALIGQTIKNDDNDDDEDELAADTLLHH